MKPLTQHTLFGVNGIESECEGEREKLLWKSVMEDVDDVPRRKERTNDTNDAIFSRFTKYTWVYFTNDGDGGGGAAVDDYDDDIDDSGRQPTMEAKSRRLQGTLRLNINLLFVLDWIHPVRMVCTLHVLGVRQFARNLHLLFMRLGIRYSSRSRIHQPTPSPTPSLSGQIYSLSCNYLILFNFESTAPHASV